MSLPGSSDRLERSYPSAQSASQASTSAAPKSSAAQLAQRPTTQPVNGVASFPQLSASTEEIVKRINANGGAQPGLQAAREQVLQRIVTSENIATPTRQTMPGRGRGRGRGRARGSTGSGTRSLRERKEGAANAPSTPTSRRGRASSRGRGGSKRGGARKRIKTEEDEEEEFDDDGQTSDPYTTSSETFTSLPTKTKSGRRVHRPTQYDPAVKTPTRRRGPYRRLAEATICRVCQRGYSPSKNMIVYCDGCNTPYHQYCHDPPIEDDVVKVEEKEWACIECTSLRRNASAKGLSEVELQTAVGGEGLSPEEKRAYFNRLSHSSLVSLLVHASSLHPSLALFSPNAKSLISGSAHLPFDVLSPAAKDINNNSTTSTGNDSSRRDDHPMPDIPYDQSRPTTQTLSTQATTTMPPTAPFDLKPPTQDPQQLAPAALFPYTHYPKSGNGLRIPPVTEDDLTWLIDDDFVAFTHLYHGQPINDFQARAHPVILGAESAMNGTSNANVGSVAQTQLDGQSVAPSHKTNIVQNPHPAQNQGKSPIANDGKSGQAAQAQHQHGEAPQPQLQRAANDNGGSQTSTGTATGADFPAPASATMSAHPTSSAVLTTTVVTTDAAPAPAPGLDASKHFPTNGNGTSSGESNGTDLSNAI